jgi:hypothetical protein
MDISRSLLSLHANRARFFASDRDAAIAVQHRHAHAPNWKPATEIISGRPSTIACRVKSHVAGISAVLDGTVCPLAPHKPICLRFASPCAVAGWAILAGLRQICTPFSVA